MPKTLLCLTLLLFLALRAGADEGEHHSHPAPEQLGKVSFATSCKAAIAPAFERSVALLHSFAYTDAERAFRDVLNRDPQCAIARWGIAMSLYHPLWEPPAAADLREGAQQLEQARQSKTASPRERQFIGALEKYYTDTAAKPAAERAQLYAAAMAENASADPDDSEMQVFYALALIATAPPTDKTHANQKKAIAILEPIYAKQPQHPGLAHYLIHACDSAELATHGLPAARAYSKIAPSAPHALHMPSHIFTRLGLWDDSIASNLAARAAAHAQGDIGEELHAMDYLTYAYLQRGRHSDARQIVDELHAMPGLAAAQFKVGYAANTMPVRLAVERKDWDHAGKLEPLPHSQPHVAAVVYWARAIGAARLGQLPKAQAEIEKLRAMLRDAQAAGNAYWTHQVEIQLGEAQAWNLAANDDVEGALRGLRRAADDEDVVEKLPVTPGPVVPAREQLGNLLFEQKRYAEALREFRATLAQSPRRLGALNGAIAAAEQLGDAAAVKQLSAELPGNSGS